jgi:hypothetical protein
MSTTTSSSFTNVFTTQTLAYITQLPEVTAARATLDAYNDHRVYFTIPITEIIRNALLTALGLDLSHLHNLPMRWIKGDTAPHIDSGPVVFKHSYLVYLTNSAGELILDTTSYPITANTGYKFNEGATHKTLNTGNEPRLLIGPMDEFGNPVGGSPVIYYSNYADAIAQNANYIALGGSYVINENTYNGSTSPYTRWRVAVVYGETAPTGTYNNGFDLLTLGLGTTSYYLYPSAPCFLEGTKVLCLVDNVKTYIPIETIKPGTEVLTSRDGYKKVAHIGKGNIQNPGNTERTENRLYKCTPANYPELTENLYITGCHSILVDHISDIQRQETIKHLGKIFVTDKKYRLIACLDERCEPWNSEANYTIWHIALENADEKMNYGVYVNGGLLVETCSINFLKNKSNMTLIES